MSTLKISLSEVSETAARIRTLNQQMFDQLTEMKREMNGTNVAWISDAAETIRSRFNTFAARFETEKETIDSYARFLDLTVQSYDSLETTINSNASGIQS